MINIILNNILAGLVLFFSILELNNLVGGDQKNKAIAIGYFAAFIYTLIFGFLLKKSLQQIIYKIPNKVRLFIALATIGSIYVESVIWLAQTFLHTKGVAISPNILIDLLMTLPFYILLAYLFSKYVLKYKFSWSVIALTGGLYEVAADGIVGNLVQLNISGVLVSPFHIPMFMIIFSPIILIPYLLVSREFPSRVIPLRKDYLVLLKPLLALIILPISIGIAYLFFKL